MTVDFSKAIVKGTLSNNAWAEDKLYVYDSMSASFLATRVEVKYEDAVP